MNEPTHDLEHLISRCLDEECTPRERRELNARLRRDPQATALFEEHSALDREVRHALRSTLGHTPARHRPLPLWERAARTFALAAAACLALTLWFTPARQTTPGDGQPPIQAGSWFASLPATGDTLVERPAGLDRPQIQLRQPDTNWIVIPSDTPGEFLVIEVNRVRTKTIQIQKDF